MFKTKFKRNMAVFVVMILIFNILPFTDIEKVNAESNLVNISIDSPNSIVLGKTKSIEVTLSNNHTDYLYNVGFEIVLEPGLSFVQDSQSIDSEPEIIMEEVEYDIDLGEGMETVTMERQKLVWRDIRDLAKNGNVNESYEISFQVKSLANKEYTDSENNTHNLPLDFGQNLIGRVRASASTDPQLLPTEADWTSYKEFQIMIEPFEVILSGGGKHLKGAGEANNLLDANRPYAYQIEVINNTEYETKIDLTNSIVSEIEVQGFSIAYNSGQYINNNDYYEVFWDDIALGKNQTKTITYDAAVFNRFTTVDGNINEGDIIQDNTSLDNNLVYSGYITDIGYTGDKGREYTNRFEPQPIKNPTIAKDIIIGKSVSGVSGADTSKFKYNDEFKYTLNVMVNGYYDVDDVVVVDTIGDGQTYVDSSANSFAKVVEGAPEDVIPVISPESGDGTRVITWNIGKIKFDDSPSRQMTLNTTVDPSYFDGTPIVANDTLVNNANVEGQGMPNYRDGDTNPIREATDGSSASIKAGKPNISKEIIDIQGKNITDKLQVGDIITFRITYTANLGVKQKNVIISDILPLGLKFIDVAPITYGAGWDVYNYTETINANRNIVTWTFNEEILESVNTLYVDVTAEVQDISEVTIDKQDQNLAKLTFTNTPNVVDSDRDGVPITYSGPVLNLSKSADKIQHLKAGDVITFQIAVENQGDAPAYDIVINDTLPSELENLQFDSGPGVPTVDIIGNNIKLTIPVLGSGTTNYYYYKATVASDIGSNYIMTNFAQLQSYKKISTGQNYIDQYKTASVAMTTDPTTIVKTIIDREHNPMRVGDWLVYKISVNVPAGNTAYNSRIEDILPTGHSIRGIYTGYVNHDIKGTPVAYTQIGQSITINTNNFSEGTHDYYIETIVNDVPSSTNTGKFYYSNKSVGGTEFNISDTAVENVNIPNLTSGWSRSDGQDDIMHRGDTNSFTYTITNNGQNTAYDFVPVIKIPSVFTATNFMGDGTPLGNIVPTSEIQGTETYNVYTLPKVDELSNGASYPIGLDITLNENRGAGEKIDFKGYTGDYYTHDNDGNADRLDLFQHYSKISVRIPMVEIKKSVIRTDYGGSTTEMRPGDNIEYNVNIKVYGGTNAYDLKIVDTLPNGFSFVSITDDNSGADILSQGYLVDDSVTEVVDTIFDLTVVATANANYGFSNPQASVSTNIVKATWNTKEISGVAKETAPAIANIQVVQPILNIIGFNQIVPDKFDNVDDVESFTLNIKNNGSSTAYDSEFKIEIPKFLEATGDTSDFTEVIENEGTENEKKYLRWVDKQIDSGDTLQLGFDLKLLSDGSTEVGKTGTLNAEIVGFGSIDGGGKSYTSSDTAEVSVEVANPKLDLYVLATTDGSELEKEVFKEDENVTLRTKITLPKGTKLADGKMEIELSTFIDQGTLSVKDGINGENVTTEVNGGRDIFKFDIPTNYTINGNNEIITDIQGKTVANSPGYSENASVNTAELNWLQDTKSLQDTAEVGLIAIDVTKNASPLNAVLGEEITYTINVINKGSESLTNVKVIDNMPPFISLDETIASLVAGANRTFIETYDEVVEADLQGQENYTITNTVNVEADYSDKTLTDNASRDVNLIKEHAINVVKTADIENPLIGDTVTYTITVKNMSTDKNLTNVTVTDPMLGINENIGALAVGESRTVTGTYVVKDTDPKNIINTASAVGYDNGNQVREDGQETITINTPPEVGNYSEITDEDVPVGGTVVGTDIDGDSLTYSKESDPTHGTVVVNPNGDWTYTPGTNYVGTDSFEVLVSDNKRGTAVSTVDITINPMNDPPDVPSYSDTTPEETPVSGTVVGTDIDGDSLTYSKGSDPSNGVVEVTNTGDWTYTPEVDFVGEDSFTVIVDDGNEGTAISTVTITVTQVNDPPTIPDYTEITWINIPVSGTLVGNDIDGDSLTYSKASDPSNGTVVVNLDGTWTYTPNDDFKGEDIFTAIADDGNGEQAISTITIDVKRKPVININNYPTVPNYHKETMKNNEVGGVVEGIDEDGDNLTYSKQNEPHNGSVVVSENGSWTYTPNNDFVGSDSFTVLVLDGKGGTAISQITIDVIENKPPTVPDYTEKTYKNISVSGTVVASDEDSNELKYSKESSPSYGTAVVKEDGNWTYTPDNDYVGIDSFKVEVKDENAQTAISTITIEVVEEETLAYKISLTANPSKILGDGESTSILKAEVVDNNGKAVEGANVVFQAPYGTFPDGNKAITDSQGKVTVIYKSEKINGVKPVTSTIEASVTDEERDLYAKDNIDVIFEPAAISGVVIDNETGEPVENAIVLITEDFDNDGTIDFTAKFVTGKDGKYKIYVPEGNVTYDINITKPVVVGDTEVNMTFKQKSEVDSITGEGGEVFDSTKTATGVLVIKKPDGKEEMLQDYTEYEVDVYDEEGHLIENTNASVDTESGVFHAENLEQKKNYKLALKREISPDVYIIVGKVDVNINDDGELNISKALIDPYGTITDSVTGEIITEADVKLYYSNTQRNIESGNTPDTIVELPIIDFPPNDNHNPQDSDEYGKYAYMVFPKTDYYIVVNKPGYKEYISPMISVELEIVKHDIEMDPIVNEDEVNNDKETKVPIPKTGDSWPTTPYLIAAILATTSYGVYRRKYRAKKTQ